MRRFFGHGGMLCLSSGEACCNCCARNLLFSSKWSIRVGWCDLERDVNAGRTASWCCFGTALREIIETSRDEEGRIAVDKMQSHATSGGLTSFLLHVTWPHLTADEANTNTQQQRFLTNTLCRVRYVLSHAQALLSTILFVGSPRNTPQSSRNPSYCCTSRVVRQANMSTSFVAAGLVRLLN